jgi:aminoglycoside phosphotransferase (APT) family kinase protein
MLAVQEFHDLELIPSPRPIGIGDPGLGYPMPWTLQTWVPGTDGLTEDPADSSAFALDLARLIRGLRAVDTRGRRFSGQGRGGDLPDHDEWLQLCFLRSAALVDVSPLRVLWAELRSLPRQDPDVMSHGDLTPANVLVQDGRLAGILDTGGFGAADPALDLVSAWHLLDRPARDLFRRELDCSDVQWARGMAWALHQAIGLVWYYADSNPQMAKVGRRSLDRILDEAAR